MNKKSNSKTPSCLTVFYLLASEARTSVGDNNNNESQQHICTDDACYRARLDPVAKHTVVWHTEDGGCSG